MKNTARVGQKYNMLTIVKRVPAKRIRWECLCDCGNTTYVYGCNLMSGKVKSCGCLHKNGNGGTHHKSDTRIYRIYREIKTRCYNANSKAYFNYGGRGIAMCDEWNNSFVSFYDWAMNNGYADSLTIDRIDNNGMYSPDNCRWVTVVEQANNRRTCRMITYQGRTQTLKQWCDDLWLSYSTVHMRIWGYGWSADDAFTRPVKKGRRSEEHG